jgi:hypothetical protein
MFLSVSLSIDCLRSLEDSPRTRAACLKYLDGLVAYLFCYVDPHETTVFEKANVLARELGGQLSTPTLSWKYALIGRFFGLQRAREARNAAGTCRMFVYKSVGRVLERGR